MDDALEAAEHGRVEAPGEVGGAKDEDPLVVVVDAVHLDEELGLDAARGLGLAALAAGGAEGVDLVDEDYGGLGFAGHGEELLDESGGC